MGRSKNMFKDIENCIRDTKYAIKRDGKGDTEQHYKMKKRLEALLEVKGYIDSYKWMAKKKSVDQLKYIRAAKYDYKLIRENLGMDDRTLRNFMNYCSRRLKSKIGASTVDLIMEDKVMLALVQYRALSGTYSLEKMIREDTMSKLPKAKFEPSALADCKKEITFLYRNTNSLRDLMYKDLDVGKLAFLRYIIEEDTDKYNYVKQELVGLLLGENGHIKDFLSRIDAMEV